MITSDKAFEGISTNRKPSTYYGLSSDAKPTKNVVNGSAFIEMDTSKIYFFDRENLEWDEFGGENGGDLI